MWLRILVAAPIVIPAALQHRPWWQLLLISFVGFGAGRLVEAGVKSRDDDDRTRASLTLAAGVVLGLAAFTVVIWGYLATPTGARAPASTHLPSIDAAPAVDLPVQRPGTWTAPAMNEHYARADRTLWCWGDVPIFDAGDRGPTPRQISSLANVSAVSVGFASTCALVDRRAWCFGWTYDGPSRDLRNKPVPAPLEDDLTAISVGTFHTCALTPAGEVWCWGRASSATVRAPPVRSAA